MTTDSKTYNVLPNEPQYGKQIETTYVYSREEIIEKLIKLFESDAVNTLYTKIYFNDISDTIDNWIDQTDLDYINEGLDYFLDDDFGTSKITNYLYDWFDNNLKKDLTYEFDTIK